MKKQKSCCKLLLIKMKTLWKIPQMARALRNYDQQKKKIVKNCHILRSKRSIDGFNFVKKKIVLKKRSKKNNDFTGASAILKTIFVIQRNRLVWSSEWTLFSYICKTLSIQSRSSTYTTIVWVFYSMHPHPGTKFDANNQKCSCCTLDVVIGTITNRRPMCHSACWLIALQLALYGRPAFIAVSRSFTFLL